MMFKELYDAIRKGSILKEAFEAVERMHNQARAMYEHSLTSLVEDRDEMAQDIKKKDHVINVAVTEVRREILEYLAMNSSPNLSFSLVLIGMIIDYERIGDYCKNIAQLGLNYPAKLEPSPYFDIFTNIRNNITEMFDLTLQSLTRSDTVKAKKVMDMHEYTKECHAQMVSMLKKGEDIEVMTAIVYALSSEYLTRISGHLQNIASTVVQPFDKVGFEEKKDLSISNKYQ